MTEVDEPERLGQRIKEMRRQRRLTLADVAAASGLTRSFLSKVERGHTAVSVASLLAISAALSTSLDGLIGATERVHVARGTDVEDLRIALLTPPAERRLVSERLAFGAGESFDVPSVETERVDFLFVVSGALDIDLGQARVHLECGDSLTASFSQSIRMHAPPEGDGAVCLRVSTAPDGIS